jgi:hypothetical protein
MTSAMPFVRARECRQDGDHECSGLGRIGAQDRVFRRWDCDLNHRSEPSGKQIRCWFSIISSVCQKESNRAVDLIQEIWQRCRIANIIGGQIGADDLSPTSG